MGSPLEGIQEFASDDLGEGFDGEEEIVFWTDPAISGRIEPPAGDHEVKMGMKRKILVPGMQDSGEAQQGPESWIP